MQCKRFLVGLVVCLAATVTAGAQEVPKEVTLFGQKYALEAHSLGGQYKNGLSVVLPPDDNKSADIRFVPGASPEQDRLFVGTAFTNDTAIVAHQFYLLTGTDANGVFNQATSNLTEFFGGSKDLDRGGRIASVTFISDVDTGVKKDRNIALSTFSGDDYLRFYDLDTLTGDYIGDAVLSKIQRCINFDEADPNMPACGFIIGAPAPNGAMIFIGRGEGEGPQLSVMDPSQDNFFNALTQLGTITEDQTTPFSFDQDPQDFELLSGNEYLILGSNPAGLGSERIVQEIYRVRLTLPADLTKAEPNSIKAEIVEKVEIFNLDESKDFFGIGPRGLMGMAVGRAVDGKPRLYFSSATGLLITANPVP
jgi:hypothetical protein